MTDTEMDAYIASCGATPDDNPSTAICECGRKYRPIYGHAACCVCRKEAAKTPRKHEARKQQCQKENGACSGSQDPTSTATVYPMSALRLFKAVTTESGWPKGLVTVGGVITICNEGEINRHAHAGTLLLVVNEELEPHELAELIGDPKTPEQILAIARRIRAKTGTLWEEMDKMRGFA